MTSDLNKNIASITYNHLNKPVEIVFNDGSWVGYLWDANGRKLAVEHVINLAKAQSPINRVEHLWPYEPTKWDKITRRDYCGNRVYFNNKLERLILPVGFLINDTIYAAIKDYQGNIVSLVNTARNTWETTEYYPFGMPFVDCNGTDRYKFSMKEYDATSGLNLYDFEARMYDPALARFMSPDPLADHYPSVSPYAYCANNPLRFTDPSGMRIEINGINFSLQLNQEELSKMTQHLAIGLNIVNDNGGRQMILELINDSRTYSFHTNAQEQGSYTQLASNGTDVNVYIGTIGLNDTTKDRIYQSIAHESMHCVQCMNNQGGASIWNEVEAYTFEQVIGLLSKDENFPSGKYFTPMPLSNSNQFTKALEQLVLNGYNPDIMNSAVQAFKRQSESNNTGIYDKYRLYNTTNNTKSMLEKYSIKFFSHEK